MKSVVFTIFAVITIIIIGFVVYTMNVPRTGEISENGDAAAIDPVVAAYFAEQMRVIGVEQIGQPIEGFDSFQYKRAFPGLEKEDFNEVEALQGVYAFTNGDLQFTQFTDGLIQSAAQAVSEEGMQTLLKNVARRLEIEVTDTVSIDTLVREISAGVSIEIPIESRFARKIVYGTDNTLDQESLALDCTERGGVFNACGTICDVDADICVAVCAFTCEGLIAKSGVDGEVLLGPTCPVVRDETECEDKPYSTKIFVLENSDDNQPVAVGKSSEDGSFSIDLAPGTYIVQAEGETPFPICGQQKIEIGEDVREQVTVLCDTGIR